MFTLDNPGPEGLHTQFCGELNKLKKLSGSASYFILKKCKNILAGWNAKPKVGKVSNITRNISLFMVSIGLVT